jgi:SNF2 family DNA or RNA helicase
MRVEVTREKDRILLRSSAATPGLSNRIPGAYWRGEQKVWSLPLNTDTCRILRAEFGDELRVRQPLTDWAKDAFAREAQMTELGRTLTGATLKIIPDEHPRIAGAFVNRPYQAVGASFVAQGRSVLIADTPGLGKTLEAIAGIIEADVPGPYLVVVPKTAIDLVWAREIARWVPNDWVVPMPDGRAKREAALRDALESHSTSSTWVIINIEMMRTKSFWVCPSCGTEWKKSDHPKANIIDCGHDPNKVKIRNDHEYPQLFAQKWGAIVMDECHRSLIRTSGTPTQQRAGAKMLESKEDGLRIALSGTPMRGKPQQLFGTLNWLRPKEYGGYWAWVQRFWDVKTQGYASAMTIGELRKDREKILYASLSGIMLRRTKQEVSPELPEKDRPGTPLDPSDPRSPVAVWLPMSGKQEKAYQEMLKTGEAILDGRELNAIGGLAELTRLKQIASAYGRIEDATRKLTGEHEMLLRHMAARRGKQLPGKELTEQVTQFRPALPSNKFDWLVQFLSERDIIDPSDAPSGKVIVASQFTSLLNLFRDELDRMGVPTLMITGAVTGRKREEAADMFNDMGSGYNVIFLNTTAGGVALTLDAADDMVILDETHVWDDQEQLEDRNNNRRPEEKVVTRRYWYLKSLGTVDEAIARVNLQAEYEGKALLDGRRGVAYVRAVFEEMKR